MADTSPPLCPGRTGTDATHCWHTIWTPSPMQAGQYDGNQMKCCWCGEQRPLMTSYTPPKPHGEHAPNNPTGFAPLWR